MNYNEEEVYLLGEENGKMREIPHKEAEKEKIKEKAKLKGYLLDSTPIYLYDKERLVIDNLIREVIYDDSYKKSYFWFWFFVIFGTIIFLGIFLFGIFAFLGEKEEVKTPKQVVEVQQEEIPKTLISKLENEIEEEKQEEPQVVEVQEEGNGEVQEFILAQEYEKLQYLFSEKKEELEICGQELNNQALYIQALKKENEEFKNKTLEVDTFTAFLGEKIWEKCENTTREEVKKTCEKLSSLFIKTQKND